MKLNFKKMFAILLSIMLIVCALPNSMVMAESTSSVDVAATETIQAALDNATEGTVINLEPNVDYGVLYVRPAKNNGTVMTCTTHDYTTDKADEFVAHLAEKVYHATPEYTTTLKNITIVGAEGATVEGFIVTSGHKHGLGYDAVRDKEYTEKGSIYYNTLYLENITFSNVNFVGKIDINISDADSVYDGINFDGCTFTTGGTADTNGAAIRYYNEKNNGKLRNITVKNSTFTNCYQGVYVHHVSGVTVTGCTFDTLGHNAIALQGHEGAVDLKEVVIEGNSFNNIADRVIRFNNVGADSNITIQNNVTVNCGDASGEIMKATSIADGVVTSIKANVWSGTVANDSLKDAATAVATVNGVEFTSFIEALQYAVDNKATEVKALCDVREKMTYDFYLRISADLTITADAPVKLEFYNEGVNFDFVVGSYNNNTLTIAENVSFDLVDRVIWIGYYGNDVDVVVEGYLGGYQIWHGADTTVTETGFLGSHGEAFIMRRDATLTVDGGKVNANYFQIYSGHINATDADIDAGLVWINNNNSSLGGEGTVSWTLDNTTFDSNGVIEVNAGAGKTVDITLTNGSKVNAKGAVTLDDSTNVTLDATSSFTKNGVSVVPTGSNSPAYTGEQGGYVRVWGEGGGNAKESFALKLYSDETLIATTILNNIGGIIDGDVYVTWNFYYPSSDDEYWTTIWEEGHPNSAAQPTKVELWIDGVCVATTPAKMSGADDINPVVWKDLGGVKYVVTGLEGSGTQADPYLINNKEELLWFQAKVDEQSSDGTSQFAGVYFKLTADIDLAGINWNPIGSMSGDHGSFKGVFDGDGHTIYNLYVEQAGNGLGLFAYTADNAVIKNLNLVNVTVKSTNNSSYLGGVVGNAYASTKIENVHVRGDIFISGCGYIGGIAGHGYVVMDNVSVVGNEGSLITSTFWCAGGILGYGGEGTTNITNAHVEGLTITSAAGGLGAIIGMAEDNEGTQPISGSNLSAKDVEIKTYVGAYGTTYEDYAMGYLYGGSSMSNLTGNLTVDDVKVETASGNPASVNDAVASINGVIYFNLEAAFNAAQEGDTIKLVADVYEPTMTLVLPVGVSLDLQAHKLTVLYLVGFNGSHILGDNYQNNGTAYGQLVVAKNKVIMPNEACAVETEKGTRYVLPVWDDENNCFVFGRLMINESGEGHGFIINEEEDTLRLQFKYKGNRETIEDFFGDGVSDNALSFIVRITWISEHGDEIVQDYKYSDTMVAKTLNNYGFGITFYGYKECTNITVTAMIVSSTGVIVSGETHTVNTQN